MDSRRKRVYTPSRRNGRGRGRLCTLGGVVFRNGFIFSVSYGYSDSRSTGYMLDTQTGNTKDDKVHARV
ncbi:unnamed protein product [Ectocarpus sp. CCAP 1310/34]|nr:unnamed protein product [Ectocarpus sp. CCAP 1310/34]